MFLPIATASALVAVWFLSEQSSKAGSGSLMTVPIPFASGDFTVYESGVAVCLPVTDQRLLSLANFFATTVKWQATELLVKCLPGPPELEGAVPNVPRWCPQWSDMFERRVSSGQVPVFLRSS